MDGEQFVPMQLRALYIDHALGMTREKLAAIHGRFAAVLNKSGILLAATAVLLPKTIDFYANYAFTPGATSVGEVTIFAPLVLSAVFALVPFWSTTTYYQPDANDFILELNSNATDETSIFQLLQTLEEAFDANRLVLVRLSELLGGAALLLVVQITLMVLLKLGVLALK